MAPSESPSAEPSAPPTGQLYYPDWENVEQICVNDGATPEYMNKIQRDNYLYTSKEECCQVSVRRCRTMCSMQPAPHK